MLIRSQDKLFLVTHDTGVLLIVGTGIRIISMSNEKIHEIIGNYSNIDKAIKVLDMIQEYYINVDNNRCRVFQMPQDSEVIT